MQLNQAATTAADSDLAVHDLGPLAWVLDELRKSLDGATKSLKRFVREAEVARGSDLAAIDTSQLRVARQQLHQAVGALEMVGLSAPAHVLRAMEAVVLKFVQRPELCSENAAAKLERASFALTEYLECVLAGKPVSSVALFPQYRDVQELAGADRVHPADLWPLEWRWVEPEMQIRPDACAYGASVRARIDQSILKVVKSGDAAAAQELRDISLGLAASQTERQPRVFWTIGAAYFEALALALVPADLYVKRAASRILLQYATLARGDQGVSDRLAQDLLFFCSQAVPARAADAPALSAIRQAYGLERFKPVDYQTSQFGLFDPALLAQARKRIEVAKETWSVLSGGDAGRLKNVADQFNLVGESLVKLHPASAPMAQALSRAVDATLRSGKPPGTELAMEVATSVLFLEAAFEDLDLNDPQLGLRMVRLAQRLERVREGAQPEALEPWMEELYRRVSDRQTMGTVVGELRTTLGELEKSLDQFFRNPQDKAALGEVPGQLSQMRGVLSVLGLEQASQAVLRMRDSVEQILVTEVHEERARAAGTFDKLGNNLGALGFLIDMLNYQPALAKKLFVYDDVQGELRPLMGRAVNATDASVAAVSRSPDLLSQQLQAVAQEAEQGLLDAGLSARLDTLAAQVALAEQPALAQSVREAATAVSVQDASAAVEALTQLAAAVSPAPAAAPAAGVEPELEEDDLRDIFLEEAREVVQSGLAALEALAVDAADVGQQTTLRRAFHTLKGSSRMVGLNEFGEAAWSMEQLLNTWLADQKPASEDLRGLSGEALQALARWVEDIAARKDGAWQAASFRLAADALRLDNRRLGLSLPEDIAWETAVPAAAVDIEAVAEPMADLAGELGPNDSGFLVAEPALPELDSGFAATQVPDELAPSPAVAMTELAPLEIDDIDFDSLFAVSDAAQVQAPASPVEAPAEQATTPHDGAWVEAFSLDAVPLVEQPAPDRLLARAVEDATEMPEIPQDGGGEVFSLDTLPLAEPAAADQRLDFTVSLEPVAQPVAEPVLDAVAEPVPQPEPLLGPVPSAASEELGLSPSGLETEAGSSSESAFDDQVKVIESLRISLPLYNVYLNEADEWSRRLATDLAEWAMELHRPVSDATVALAHSLGGSSATVGFQALSDMARALEHALQRVQLQPHGAPAQAKLFVEAAEDVRRLLHQFAAGFLKEPSAELMQALKEVQAVTAVAESSNVVALANRAEPHVAAAAVMVAAPVAQDEEDDEIDVTDMVDADLFPVFEEEAAELLPQLGAALRQWTARPGNLGARAEVLRALHTLKGSARLAGALRLGEMAHHMESEIEHLGSDEPQGAQLEPLLTRFDGLQAAFDKLRSEDLELQPESAAPASEQAAEPAAVAASQPAADAGQGQPRSLVALPATSALAPLRQASSHAVRVRSQLLDRLVNQAGEVMITRSRLEAELGQLRVSLGDLTGNLDRLRQQLRDIELQAETQMQSRLAQAKDSQQGFDPLEFDRFTRVQELTRMMAESVNDVATVQRNLQRTVEATEDDLNAQARQTRELQRDLLRTRMVEFEGISERLYRVVRQASKDTGKQVKLDIVGGSIEMDRGVLDRMTPAFEHLLRNCVAHGIEDPDVRLSGGKEAAGTITIGLHHEGNDVSVEFSDDGAGLHLARIRDKALAQGLIAPGHELTDAEAANLIFMPGFSTASQVSELAGRGIGMDVVRAEVNALGGRIETSSVSGQGARFKLVLPLTTAVTQVVMMRCGDQTIGVPSNVVELVRRASAKELQQAYNSGVFDFGGEPVPFFWSGALLQSSRRSHEAQGKTLPVVIFRSASQRVAVHVDEVLGNQEVVVKNLGPQLSRLPGLAGMTVLASGAVVLIYNPVALASVYGERARSLSADQAQPDVLEATSSTAGRAEQPVIMEAAQIPLVLVVDDSITVRRVTQRLLQREGYRVSLAVDGLQALERLQEERPTVVLSDIEMPRMDGFDLARNIRGDRRLQDLPIIMITSRIAGKHREHAEQLGVNHYLGKPYSEEELLSLVRRYAAAEVSA